MMTIILFLLFLFACFGLVYSVGLVVVSLAYAIIKAIRKKPVVMSFTHQVWAASLSFTYIMGYLFIPF